MESMEIKKGAFLHNFGVLHIPREKTVAIADLHLGFEAALSESGSSMPRAQEKPLKERLENILDRLKPERMIVVGDLKHNFDRNLSQEWDEVQRFVDYMADRTELVVLRGNHDNYLINILRRHDIGLLDSYKLGGITFAHGHKKIEYEGMLVMGHEHPSIGLRDPVGGRVKLPCFLYGEKEDVVVLPAISPLAKGTDVLRSSSFFSPILKDVDPGAFSVWGVSDIGLLSFGTVFSLRKATIEQEQW